MIGQNKEKKMGFSFSCFRQSSLQRLADQHEMKHDDNRSACSGTSSMMLGCLWTKQTKERQLQMKKRQINKGKELTLEDWLIASPGLQKNNGAPSGGEYHVFKHSSKRVFPSFMGENSTNSSSKARESFPKERLLIAEDIAEREDIEVCFSRNQSGKSKKRVSFRLPEEADIFIFHSSGEEESEDKEI